MELPEITEAERLHFEPGDCLVLHLNASEVSQEIAAEVRDKVRVILGRPDLPVLILARDMSVKVISG